MRDKILHMMLGSLLDAALRSNGLSWVEPGRKVTDAVWPQVAGLYTPLGELEIGSRSGSGSGSHNSCYPQKSGCQIVLGYDECISEFPSSLETW